MESLVTWFMETLGGKISKEMIVFVISMVPILELRGGLLAASVMNIDIVNAIWYCVIGNIIPVFNWLKKTKTFRPMVEKLESRAMGKSEQIEKYQFLGLVLFVGIPLPGTGAWTGSLIASLLGMKFKKAFPAVLLGIVMATVIMSIVSYGLLGALIH